MLEDALSIQKDDLGQRFIVRLVICLWYKDGHKGYYASTCRQTKQHVVLPGTPEHGTPEHHGTFRNTQQRSKFTFSKNRLLATFNFKMVAIKRNSVAKKTLGSGGHFMTYYTNG